MLSVGVIYYIKLFIVKNFQIRFVLIAKRGQNYKENLNLGKIFNYYLERIIPFD